MLSLTVDQFLLSCEARGLTAATLHSYRYHLTRFAEFIATEHDWRAPRSIEIYLAARRRLGLSPSTLASDHRILTVFFNWCLEHPDVDLTSSPMSNVKRVRQPRTTPDHVSLQDYERLLDSIERQTWIDYRDTLLIVTLFLTGIRVGGLVQLRIDDYDLISRSLTVINKGGDTHQLPLLRPVAEAFVEYRYNRPNVATDAVFVSAHGPRQTPRGAMTANGVRNRLKTLCARAGINYLSPHAFRHGLARHLLQEHGADMSLISRILGHTDERTTSQIYAIWDDDGTARAYARLMGEDW